MPASRNRRRIAAEAARLLFERVEGEYYAAKFRAAKRLGLTLRNRPADLPTNSEVRTLIRKLADARQSPGPVYARLRDRRLAALRLMRVLSALRPRLLSDRDERRLVLLVDAGKADATTELLRAAGLTCDVCGGVDAASGFGAGDAGLRVVSEGSLPAELDVVVLPSGAESQPASASARPATAPITIAELESRIATEHPEVDLPAIGISIPAADPYLVWSMLLPPLERVKQDPQWHPEGDALYHSLQAFDLARQRYPYDEEMISAALLHDVGKAVDLNDHVAAGLGALEGTLSPRVEFLIAHHMHALAYADGTLPQRLRHQIRASEWFEDLLNLREIDNDARQRGVDVCTVDEAIDHLRQMAGSA